MTMQMTAIFVALADLGQEELVQFYRRLFGQEPTVWIAQVYAEFELPGLKLGIFQPKVTHRSEFVGRSGSMSLCLEVEQLETAIDHLVQLGCPPPGEMAIASHGREIYAYDPAGNRLILHESVSS